MDREQILRAYVEAFNAGDWNRIVELFTPGAEIRGVLGWGGLDVALPIWRELHDYMKMQLIIDDMVIDGSKGALLLKETGRFSGPFRGLAGHEPTDRPYEIVAIEWFDFEDDLIRRRWAARDSGAISRQVLA